MNKLSDFLIVFILSTAVFSFDGERKGFYLGGGSGGSFLIHIFWGGGTPLIEPRGAFCLDGRSGVNFNDKFELGIAGKADILHPYLTTIANTSYSLEFTFYRKKAAPSLFFYTAPGFSLWFYPFSSIMNQYYMGKGICFSLGTGYEFRRHCSLLLESQFSCAWRKDHISTYKYTIYNQLISTEPTELTMAYGNIGFRLTLRYSFY